MKIIDRIWLQGVGKENEDIAGSAGDFAWVLDGATALIKRESNPYTPRWLVEKANAVFEQGAQDCQSLQALLNFYQTRFPIDEDCRTLSPEETPSFAMAIIRQQGGFLEYLTLADCYIVLRDKDKKITVLSDQAWAAYTSSITKDTSRFYAQETDKQIDRFIDIRKTMNTPEGYWVGTADGKAFSHNQPQKIAVEPGTEILLCSDGFERVIEFGLYRWDEIFDLPLAEIGATLREAENNDSDRLQYPRFKISDDVVAIRLIV